MSFSFLQHNKYEDIILVKLRTGKTANFRLFPDESKFFQFRGLNVDFME
ncbi:hypothetical protein B4096_3035 [Heyndrickxia coagulans]|uniref:Uncharacterized protein n=1 Tax=Heyndrickxia coagulans TaxID=1398 RepID=A0A150JNX4_HEYCO|nr:hypothetical protein B4099_2611 [Heyndrickxia coagulans]KYC64610.1 hypothetical protein B4100_2692 [Heyndrickxia coagulans]KYC92079.1 hypothetical protein B4096_3035 [Heyndrickxia coagulans]